MNPYYEDDAVTLWHGDSLAVLREMPDRSVDCCVTSPPYFGLRDYGVEGQYGLEASPAEYVETMRALFAEVRRVLADDGTLWLNIGDSYSGSGKGAWGSDESREANRARVKEAYIPTRAEIPHAGKTFDGLPAKNLMGIPWRVAFALQDDGWTLRNDIIWSKPNAMPESVTDRLSARHEHLFMFSKSPRYWFDLDPIRETLVKGNAGSEFHTGKTGEHQLGRASKVSRRDSFARGTKEALVPGQNGTQHRADRPDVVAGTPSGRNPGDVWTIATQPFSEAHFAVMPQALAERAILAGCKPGGVVLDPFSGSGTTGMAATKHGRRYVGIDLSQEYLDLSLRTRLAQASIFTP